MLNGVQLWVALPDAYRNLEASFQHLDDVPRGEQVGGIVSLFAGSVLGRSSAGKYFSPLLGADLAIHGSASLELPLDLSFEHAVRLLSGDAKVDLESILPTGIRENFLRFLEGFSRPIAKGRPADHIVRELMESRDRIERKLALARSQTTSEHRGLSKS